MATIAVGDIHGNVAALDDLLAILCPDLGSDDTLVFLGDYIDDGEAVPACIDRILDLKNAGPCRVVALMGNHEQWMLRSRDDHTKHSWILGMAGLRTVQSYSVAAADAIGREIEEAGPAIVLDTVAINYDHFFEVLPRAHMDFFLTLRASYKTPDVLCVHGGFPGGSELPPDDLLIWGPSGFPQCYEDEQLVVYGHHNNAVLDRDGWPHPHVVKDRAFGIDTIRLGVLTAMRFPDQTVFQSRRFSDELIAGSRS